MAAADQRSISQEQLEAEAYDWVVVFASRDAGQADIDALKHWAARSRDHVAAFERASQTWNVVGAAAHDADAMTPVAAIREGRRTASRLVRFDRRVFLGGALAASAAAVAIVRPPLDLWPSWSELAADYRTDTGETRQIQPFDNIAIEMNTRTSIAKLNSHDGAERIEILSGEALISATGSKVTPFTVVAGDADIVARDARFNVRRDTASICVTCLDGEVQIAGQSSRQTIASGQQLIYADGGMVAKSAVDTTSVTAWQSGLLIFHATPVSDVITEVNRYRRGRIILTNATLGRERLSARFRIAGIDQIIDQIHEIFGARVTSLPGGIVLLS